MPPAPPPAPLPSLPFVHSPGHVDFRSVFARFVVLLVPLGVGQVLLLDPALRIVMRVVVPDAVAQRLRTFVVSVTQMRRHFADRAVLHILPRVPDGQRRTVALRSR